MHRGTARETLLGYAPRLVSLLTRRVGTSCFIRQFVLLCRSPNYSILKLVEKRFRRKTSGVSDSPAAKLNVVE